MKQKIYIIGLVAALSIAVAICLKVNHLVGASILMTVGIAVLVLLFLPMALINNFRAEGRKNPLLYVVTWLSCFVVFTSMLFKVMHWPGSGYFLPVALPFPFVVFLPVFLYTTSKDKNFNIYNTVFVLFLLASIAVLTAMLSLNVSRTRIYDSYDLSRKYNRIESVFSRVQDIKSDTPEQKGYSLLYEKIDGLVEIINGYQNLIFAAEGITKEQWISDPDLLKKPDVTSLASNDIRNAGEAYPGEKLESGMKNLLAEFEKTPGCEDIAKAAPAVFHYSAASKDDDPWALNILKANPLSWSMISLDGLKESLMMIKASLKLGK